MADGAVLRSISAAASPEEVAAALAAIAAVDAQRRAVVVEAASDDGELRAWVRASRLTARRAGLMRGPWRISGRIGRRARA